MENVNKLLTSLPVQTTVGLSRLAKLDFTAIDSSDFETSN